MQCRVQSSDFQTLTRKKIAYVATVKATQEYRDRQSKASRARWEKLSPKMRSDAVRPAAKMGGLARSAKLTKEQRQISARHAAQVRWDKKVD
jgi:ribosomal protein L2